MLGVFNKEELANLLKKALGNRSAYQYGPDVDVSRNQISRLIGQKQDKPPTAETLKKLASKAENEVTYEQLMIAAGYLADEQESVNIAKMIEADVSEGKAKHFSDIAPPGLSEDFQKLNFELVSFAHDNELTREELEEMLIMLRALKEKKQQKK